MGCVGSSLPSGDPSSGKAVSQLRQNTSTSLLTNQQTTITNQIDQAGSLKLKEDKSNTGVDEFVKAFLFRSNIQATSAKNNYIYLWGYKPGYNPIKVVIGNRGTLSSLHTRQQHPAFSDGLSLHHFIYKAMSLYRIIQNKTADHIIML